MIHTRITTINLKELNMTKKIKPIDNTSNQKNPNKGTSGTNRQNGQVHGNRSKQIQQGGN